MKIGKYKAAQSTTSQGQSTDQIKSNKLLVTKDAPISKPKSNVQKLNSKERQELEDIPAKIDILEMEQAQIGVSLGDADLYKSNPQQVVEFQNRLKLIEEQLIQLMARWEDLLKRSDPS
jgi:ATP-binding cassette subfamily F protein uup